MEDIGVCEGAVSRTNRKHRLLHVLDLVSAILNLASDLTSREDIKSRGGHTRQL